MRVFGVAVVTALVALVAQPVWGETSRATLAVSVQVTRSCRVVRSADEVSVGCGSRKHLVRVTHNGDTNTRAIAGPTPIASAPASLVVVEF